ncbi:MAG TPA: cation:proton antiporter [Solirubrobacteraceae bacterium]|nr:cation:proton antiporter [Solirubrobacteraceae bacterium]
MFGIAFLLLIVVLWALVARRLETMSVTMAIALVIVGALLTRGAHPAIDIRLDTRLVERGVELVLAILLFVDANEVPGAAFSRERGALARLLIIALPLSLLIAWGAGFLLFSGRDAWLLAVLAVIVVPVDLAPAVAMVRDRRVPARLRDILNVESGLNDGMVAPVFLFVLAGAGAKNSPAIEALDDALPAILIAVGVGAAVGLAGALSLSWSWRRKWTEPSALRLGVVALPVMTYVLALGLGGNGFVAAFVAGVVFAVGGRELPAECLQLTEDTGALLSLCVWFLFGAAVNDVLDAGLKLDAVLYALLALTVVRVVPVMLALRGTDISRRDALFIGWMGPRGLASLVFGLLAVIGLAGSASDLAAEVMVTTVLLSVLLHGASARPIAAAFARADRRAATAEEPAPLTPSQPT